MDVISCIVFLTVGFWLGCIFSSKCLYSNVVKYLDSISQQIDRVSLRIQRSYGLVPSHSIQDREELGEVVRLAWVRWARQQSHPKPSWLVPYVNLNESDKEADRQIGEAVVRFYACGEKPGDDEIPNAAHSR